MRAVHTPSSHHICSLCDWFAGRCLNRWRRRQHTPKCDWIQLQALSSKTLRALPTRAVLKMAAKGHARQASMHRFKLPSSISSSHLLSLKYQGLLLPRRSLRRRGLDQQQQHEGKGWQGWRECRHLNIDSFVINAWPMISGNTLPSLSTLPLPPLPTPSLCLRRERRRRGAGRAEEKDLGLFGTSSEQQPARGQKMEVAEWLDDQSPYLLCNVH